MTREKLLDLLKDWLIPLVVGAFVLAMYLPNPQNVDSSRPFSEWIKIWIASGGVCLVLAWKLLPRGIAQRVLIALTLVAGLNYYRYTPEAAFKSVDAYDLIHYYLGAKYFEELGYYDLYPAALLVDSEHRPYDKRATFYRAQDPERGYRESVSVREAIERGREVKERFTPDRWRTFERDFLVLQREKDLGRSLWRELINDRGFNGTPAWLVVGKPIANLVPVSAIKALCYLDAVLLTAGLFALWWAYGWVTSLWALFFLFVTYSLRWPYVTWAFLRYDWVAALMVAMACLKKAKWVPAGVLTAYAALVRFFPVVWMFGPFMKGVASLIRPSKDPLQKKADRRMLLMAGGFLGFALLLEGTAIGAFGMDAVKTHADNIREHIKPEELSSRRIGFALAFAYDGRGEPKWLAERTKVEIKEAAPARTVLAVLLLGVLGWALRKRRPDEAFAVGFIPFFMLATASYYYLVCRITLIAWHASDLGKLRNRVGLAWLLFLEVLTNFAETFAPGYRVMLIGNLAWGLLAYAVGLTIALTWEAGGFKADVAEDPPDERPIVDGEPDDEAGEPSATSGALGNDADARAGSSSVLEPGAASATKPPAKAKAKPKKKKKR